MNAAKKLQETASHLFTSVTRGLRASVLAHPERWGEELAANGYIAGWKLIAHLPLGITAPLFRVGADIASKKGKGMPQLRKNLVRVVGENNVTDALIRDSMRSYTRYWLEAFRLPSLAGDPTTVQRFGDAIIGKDHLEASINSGKGVVLVLPHTGNWDMAGMFLTSRYSKFTTVAERLKPERLFDAFVEYRQSLGFKVLAHEGATGPYEELRNDVSAGGIVCLLGERDLKKSGVEVEFFGETTRMPAGAARLALDTGAPLHVVHTWFEGDGWGTSISKPLKSTTLSGLIQEMAGHFEENIRQHPVDWHMLQPLWLADLDQKRYEKGIS